MEGPISIWRVILKKRKRKWEILSTKRRIFESIYHESDPQTIHWRKEKRVYSYEKNYEKLLKEKNNDIFWKNSYYDYDKDMEIEFFDYHLGTKKYLYFLYYELTNCSFHTPIQSPKKI